MIVLESGFERKKIKVLYKGLERYVVILRCKQFFD